MSLNPLTALLEQLQKLINEHGSAAILRDHVALFKDQVVILEKRVSLLESENGSLANETKDLKAKLELFAEENQKLQKAIEGYEQSDHTNLRFHQEFGVLWDKDLKMRCLNCHKLLKYGSIDPSIVHCSDPKCNSKHTIRDEEGQKITVQKATRLIKTSKKIAELFGKDI